MSNNSTNLLFFTFMLMGILVSVSSNNWLGCWMGIEINMISFLPIMIDSMSVYTSESMMKYFIIQSMGSSLFFISIVFMNIYNMMYITMISLLIKIGCPPFHMWYPSVMEGLTWMCCFLLGTVQKFIPLVMLSYLSMNMILFMILSSLWGSIGGLTYSSMRKIIAYSSIYNLGWIIGGLMINNYMWLMYFIIYSINLMMVCNVFFIFSVNYFNQLFMLRSHYIQSLMVMIIFMSMGGLPPFLGFLPKLIMMYCFIMNEMIFSCFILVISALLIMFFYLRVVFTGLLINSLSMKLMIFMFPWKFYVFSMISLMGMLLLMLINLYF
uniref:NADH-ubiquinone oxidoreductase chain 2 n=1 Tax=Cryptotympana atrata TaxID=678702 RepID=A0A344ALD7_9HEMI|nr:NADH dehydrogenase subunit 2 [Cryptotympana atrata]AWV83185.1 NADH dehydrogenase subunit 2 [Cryptotympana atrata]QUV77440.1 NADH dehydrogenase subunit 2 [Cryptotympana atrata]